MTGAVKRRTTNFGFNIINYDFPRWHTYDWQNWDVVDAVLAAANLTSVRGIWENATDYVPGDRVVDDSDASLWVCNVAHTSAASGTFLDDQTANPTYWTSVSSVPIYRGTWTTATNYVTQDIVKQGVAYYLCITTHTSAVFADDLAAGRWTLILSWQDALDAATAAAASASAAAISEGNAASSASAAAGSASSASTSATNAGNSATAASGSATTAGTAATNAANSASAANTSAGNAATSATNAGNSATAAFNSAIAAAGSASAASTSVSNAAASAAAAAADVVNTVKIVAQSFTSPQQNQALTNLGANSFGIDILKNATTLGATLAKSVNAVAARAALSVGYEIIGYQRLTVAAASIIFTTNVGNYVNLRAEGILIPVSAGGGPVFRLSKDGGSTWLSGASDYYSEYGYFAGGGYAAGTLILNYGPMASTSVPAAAHTKINLELVGTNVNGHTLWNNRTVFNNGAGSMILDAGGGQTNGAGASGVHNGIQFLANTGNLDIGSYIFLYGQRVLP